MTSHAFEGRHTTAGVLILLGGILIGSLVPYCFTLPEQGWVVGLVIFGPMSGYMLFEGSRRLLRKRLEFDESGIRFRTRFTDRRIAWDDLTRIRAQVESDDESRIILTLYGQADTEIRIAQGSFRVPELDAIIRSLDEQIARRPAVVIDDMHGVWSGWDDYIKRHRKLHPRQHRRGRSQRQR